MLEHKVWKNCIGPWQKSTAMFLDPRCPSGNLRVIFGNCKNVKSDFIQFSIFNTRLDPMLDGGLQRLMY